MLRTYESDPSRDIGKNHVQSLIEFQFTFYLIIKQKLNNSKEVIKIPETFKLSFNKIFNQIWHSSMVSLWETAVHSFRKCFITCVENKILLLLMHVWP